MGDIHGFYQVFYERFGQLGNLHTVLDQGVRDRLILLGGYIDGGLDGFRVLELIHGAPGRLPRVRHRPAGKP